VSAVRKQRVGTYTITITSRRAGDVVGIGDRWSAEVDGKVTVLASAPGGLYVGTGRGVVSRLETVTGRQCARCELGAPIEKLAFAGRLVTITTRDGDTVLLARSLRVPNVPK
jgi:hypothetical protein